MMRALYLDRQLRMRRDYPYPSERPGEAIVRVIVAGICGTDLELARGYMAYQGVPGHEFVGEVEHTTNPELRGARVVGEINAGCGRCDYCAKDLARHCPQRTVLGILGRDGAFADFLTVPETNLMPVPESVPDEMAVFTEPLAAAYEILEQSAVQHAERILILGDGRLGAMVGLVLGAEGYAPLLAGHHPKKLARLTALGFATRPEADLSPSDLFDTVIDCTGASAGFSRAMALVRPRGKLVLKSTAASGANLNLAPIVINEITVIGSRCGRFAPALQALASGRIDPRPLISAVYPLEDGLEAIAAAAQPDNFKVLLKMD